MSDENDTPIVDDSLTSEDMGMGYSDQITEESQESSSPEAELKQEVEEAIENGASEEEVKDMIKEFTIKVNGKQKKVKFDLSDEKEVIKKLQLAEAGRSSMQEAAELKKMFQSEIERLRKDPWAVLKELDMDPDELAEQRLRAKIAELKKTPEQLEKERMHKELEEARKQLKQREEETKMAQFEQLKQSEAKKLDDDLDRVLSAHSTLPKTPQTVARIANAMLWAMENAHSIGLDPDDITVEDVIPSVEAEIKREFDELLEALGDDGIEQYFGKKRLDRYRKKRIEAMKQKSAPKVQETASKVEKTKEQSDSKKKVYARDFFRNLG